MGVSGGVKPRINGEQHAPGTTRCSAGRQWVRPHLHVYREGYGDKWAVPVPADRFGNLADVWQTLSDFMGYCNITQPPRIQRGLFT